MKRSTIHRMDMRMRMYARVELHAAGELNNPHQVEEVLLLRARLAALLGAAERETTTPLPPTTNSGAADGSAPQVSEQEELPF